MFTTRLILPVLLIIAKDCYADVVVQHQCAEIPDGIKATLRVLPNDGLFHSIYGFDASTGQIDLFNGRIEDCKALNTHITDPNKDTAIIEATVNAVVSECGVHIETTADGAVTFYNFLFHLYSIENMIGPNDKNYGFTCRSDALNTGYIATETADIRPGSIIVIKAQQYGAYLRPIDPITHVPKVVTTVGDSLKLSAEFHPSIGRGPDNYGTLFHIAYLANAAKNSAETPVSLFFNVYPKYPVTTHIQLRYGDYNDIVTAIDGQSMSFGIPADYMGCSDPGFAELEQKGIEIYSFDMEVGVIVFSSVADAIEQYTAIPDDVLGNEYYVTTNDVTDPVSYEFIIIATEDDTDVTLDLPENSPDTTYDGNTFSAGSSIQLKLQSQDTFHLSFNTHFPSMQLSSSNNIAVVTGTRAVNGNHMVSQLVPTERGGKRYVLPLLSDQSSNAGLTTKYIIIPLTQEITTVKQFTGNDEATFVSIEIPVGQTETIIVNEASQCEIEANHPIQIMVDYTNPTQSDSASEIIPAIHQWTRSYVVSGDFMHDPPNVQMSLTYVYREDLQLKPMGGDFSGLSLTGSTVLGPSGYMASTYNLLPSNQVLPAFIVRSVDEHSAFMILILHISGQSRGIYNPLGVLMPVLEYCLKVGGKAGDKIDNDCDTLIDEEFYNGIDDDGDGRVDEDISEFLHEYTGAISFRPYNCRVSAVPTFEASLTHQLTDGDGCKVTSAPFYMDNGFVVQTGTNIGGLLDLKILHTGSFFVNMFIGYPKLYFKCDIEFCYSMDDPKCTTAICAVRAKRQSDRVPINNISSSVWVYPVRETERDKSKVVAANSSTFDDCLQNTTILISGSMLLGTALVSMAATCCMCMMFCNRWRRGKKTRKLPVYLSSKHSPCAFPSLQY